MNTFLHEQDAGDLLYSLPAVRAAGGGEYRIKKTKAVLYGLLRDLFERQSYIGKFRQFNGEKVTHDFSTFRKGGIPYGVSLGKLHADWIGVSADFDTPWIKAEPSAKTIGKILVNKTARYNNPFFPWKRLLNDLKGHMAFVGLRHEHGAFCAKYGVFVEFLPTFSLDELASLIAGCEMFVGNQSSPFAIAEGLKHPSVQETCLWVPDCIYPRDNCHYCFDGNLRVDFRGKVYEYDAIAPQIKANRHECPPGGWKAKISGNEYQSYSFQELVKRVRVLFGQDCPANIEDMVEAYTVNGLPLEAISQGTALQVGKIRAIVSGKTS